MAKVSSKGDSRKITFGARKLGKAKRAFNKHDRKSRVYRGQGR
jgi:hypothetical protein